MNITDIEVIPVEVPLPDAFYPSWIPGFPQMHNRFTLVKIKTDDGITGIAAGVAFMNEGAGVANVIKPFLFGRDPFNVEEIVKILRNATYLGYRMWYLEIALWDIIGKACNKPVYKLLGGYQKKIKTYCSTGECRDAKTRVKDVLKIKEMGFKAVKLRFKSENPFNDIETLAAVREAVGPDFDIMVDANQAWPVHGLGAYTPWNVTIAVQMLKEMEKYNVRWVEEPLYKNDYEGLQELRRKTNIPIAGGEQNQDLDEFRDLIEKRCYDILQPDATLSGGILNSRKVATMCEAHNLQMNPHTWTNGIGFAANLHVMAAIPNCTYCEFPYEPPGWVPEAREGVLKEVFMPDANGYITVSDKPGLGIELDEEKVEKYRLRG